MELSAGSSPGRGGIKLYVAGIQHQDGLEVNRPLRHLVLLLVMVWVCDANATTYTCPQPDGSVVYTDRAISAGCRELQSPPISQQKNANPLENTTPTPTPTPARPVLPLQQKTPAAVTFTPGSRIVHTLGFIQPAFSNNVQAHNALPGTTTPVTITVQPLADGSGPKVSFSSKFSPTWQQSARQAAVLAAQVVKLAPSAMAVSFTIEATPLALFVMGNTDGPSGGGLLTVGVLAALLDDPIDPTVCMTGTIQSNLTIGPIGAVPQKMLGCKERKATRMLIPYGQTDSEVRRSSLDTGIQVIEVRSLAEAYELMTGKPLRRLTGY